MSKNIVIKRLAVLVIIAIFITGCARVETHTEDTPTSSTNVSTVTQTEDTTPAGNKKEESKKAGKETNEEGNEKNANINYIPAHITRVVDGDTLEATIDGKVEKIRLVLVDTPETVHPSKPVQPFGPEASKLAKEILEGQDVRLELDVSERDQYGRVLAYVWIGDTMFNEMLLEKGLARVAVYPPDVKYVDRFREVQKEAQEKGVGIWSIENYASEDGYNDNVSQEPESSTASKVSDNCADPQIKGNINSRGEKIYHLPEGQYYDATNPEEMFCTEAEAQAAGFRKSKR